MIEFAAVADGVFVARTQPLDVNVTLVVGDEGALVIDTLSTDTHATELLSVIRTITTKPLTVLNTHFHFDHWYGNAVIAAGGRPIWAHENAVTEVSQRGSHWHRRWIADYAESDPALAERLANTTIQIPDHVVRETQRIDLGGRTVTVTHPGRGHTDGDLIATVDGADVLVAGDLIEESGPPDFTDAYPLDWPEAIATMLHHTTPTTVIVPGHGALVDREFATVQHTDLAAFAWLIRSAHRDGGTVDAAVARAPWPAHVCRPGVERGFAALDLPNA